MVKFKKKIKIKNGSGRASVYKHTNTQTNTRASDETLLLDDNNSVPFNSKYGTYAGLMSLHNLSVMMEEDTLLGSRPA